MNLDLQKIFTFFYNERKVPADAERGASSTAYTERLRSQMLGIFKKHNILSMFDAGCNDCTWMSLLSDYVDYSGGDISPPMVAQAKQNHPEFDVIVHDVTTDPLPTVDLLFVRDVAIHLNQHDKWLLFNNWVSSGIPWIMITNDPGVQQNHDFKYDTELNEFPVAGINWSLAPWNFPSPTDCAYEMQEDYGRGMALWHINQLRGILYEIR